MKNKVSVFDIDGTILRDTSTERLFFRHLLEKGGIGLKEIYNISAAFLKYILTDAITATKGNKWYLKGKDYENIRNLGMEFFRNVITKRISGIAVDIINSSRQQGYEIILLSGAFDFFMDEYLKYLHVEKGFGTVLEVEDGKLTGRTKGIFPYGINKVRILETDMDKIDLANSFAYANDFNDRHLLKLFGNAVAVNPDRRLLKYARENNFRVLYS